MKIESTEVATRQLKPVTDPEANSKKLRREDIIYEKDAVMTPGAKAMPCKIIKHKDVPLKMRDGVTIYADIYTPETTEKIPAIVNWAPYGKGGTGSWNLDKFPNRVGIPKNRLTGLQEWEGNDPGYWCDHGYAVVQIDARGAFNSEGDISYFGSQEGRDGYDSIELISKMAWCNGKVALSGNSWLALSQWRIAELCPPHLAAIAPWEGLSDPYRDIFFRGGIPDPAFPEAVIEQLYGRHVVEDPIAMMKSHPLIDGYWKDKIIDASKIKVPVYVVASYTNPVHIQGTFRAWRQLKCPNWLRIHNTVEWPDFYTPKYVEDLRKFFDYYLKGSDNHWPETPKVRMSILNPGHQDSVDQVETTFPVADSYQKSLYLNANDLTLSEIPLTEATHTNYLVQSDHDYVDFTYQFKQDTEISGYPVLKLWLAVQGANDADLHVQMQKLSSEGQQLIHQAVIIPFGGSHGELRASMRKPLIDCKPLDYAFDTVEKLKEGQITPLKIALTPIAMKWCKGEILRLRISASPLSGPALPGLPTPPKQQGEKHTFYTGDEYESKLMFNQR